MKTEKKVNLSARKGFKETTQPNQSQVYRNQRGDSFSQASPIIKTSQVDLVESIRWVVKGRMGQGTKVD